MAKKKPTEDPLPPFPGGTDLVYVLDYLLAHDCGRTDVPDDPEQRKAVEAYIAALPPRQQRRVCMKFISFLVTDPVGIADVMEFLWWMSDKFKVPIPCPVGPWQPRNPDEKAKRFTHTLGDVAGLVEAAKSLSGTLKDVEQGGTLTRQVRVKLSEQSLDIYVEGYGNHTMEPGASSLAALEIYGERLQLLVYGDMNDESPEKIDLEGANETERKPEDDAQPELPQP